MWKWILHSLMVDMFPHSQALSGYLPSNTIVFRLLIFDSYAFLSKHVECVTVMERTQND